MKNLSIKPYKIFTYWAIASSTIFLSLLPLPKLVIAQTKPKEIVQPQEVRPLPGKLDNIPVFNSNSPEGVNPVRVKNKFRVLRPKC